MEKLTEKINSFKIDKPMKDELLEIADNEDMYLQQVCRKMLKMGIEAYKNSKEKRVIPEYYGQWSIPPSEKKVENSLQSSDKHLMLLGGYD